MTRITLNIQLKNYDKEEFYKIKVISGNSI